MLILSIVIAIILVPVIAASFMSDDFFIETELTINKPKSEVFNFIKFLGNSNQYNKWVMQDPNLRKEMIGTDGTVGFEYKWDSDMKSVGQGEQKITGIIEGERIDYALHFIKPFKNVATSSITTRSAGDDQTVVAWSFGCKRPFGMRIFHFLFNLKKMLLKDLHTNLLNLKNILEK